MSIGGEEILMTSDEVNVGPEGDELKKVTARIHQEKKQHNKKRDFYILGGKFLGVRNVQGKSKQKYWANLLFVDPVLRHERTVTWPFIFLALALTFFASLLLLIDMKTDWFPDSPIILSVIVLLFTGALVFIGLTIYHSTNSLVLYSQHGSFPLAEFFNGNPSKKELEQFINALKSCIEKVRLDCRYTQEQLLPAEVAEYRRLKDEGIISEATYEEAKLSLFSKL